MAMYVFVWGIFLESGALVYEKRHFAFEALAEGIKNRRAKQLIVLFDSLVKLAFSLMAVYYGCVLREDFWQAGRRTAEPRLFMALPAVLRNDICPVSAVSSVGGLDRKRDADSEEPVKEEGEKC